MRRFLRGPAAILTVVFLIAGCDGSNDTVDETTTATPASTVAPPETATTAATTATTTTADAAATTTTAAALQVARSLSYTVDGSTQLDVFAPNESGPWPVVLVIPGAFQSRSAYEFLAEAIASEGAVVFNVGVRLHKPFPEATEQVACAVRFAKATAADYGGDDTEITLVGHSAGAAAGMVVAMAGDYYAQDCVVTDESAVLNVLVGYEGPYDWATQDYDVINLVPLREEDPDQWEAIDPYAHIGGNPDLVVRLIHGDDADVAWYEVPRDVSVDFNQVLFEAGYDVELTLLEGADHGALLFPGSEVVDVTVQQALQPGRG
jgi:acetyl esterase/lipase